jgi:FkbM family methyltransferase
MLQKIKKIIGLSIHESGRFVVRVGFACMSISKYIYRPQREIEVASRIERDKPWHAIHGDTTLRFDYNLDDTSIIFDLGGYEGEWSQEMFSRYASRIYIFEPVHSFATNIQNRFKKNKKVSVYAYGLGNSNTELDISIETASSSLYKSDIGPKEKIKIVNIKDFFDTEHITHIDLMKINIEGGEYDLLDYLIETKLIHKIDNIQVQFHDFVPHAKERMHKIQHELKKSHTPTYQYEFVWENWKRNNI